MAIFDVDVLKGVDLEGPAVTDHLTTMLSAMPQVTVLNRDQSLGNQTEFRFLKSGQKVTAEVPLPWLMGEPAWDEHYIGAPTFTGLYEIDRATGHAVWLAHEDGNPFLSVLKHGGRLYIATGRGLYYREIP